MIPYVYIVFVFSVTLDMLHLFTEQHKKIQIWRFCIGPNANRYNEFVRVYD